MPRTRSWVARAATAIRTARATWPCRPHRATPAWPATATERPTTSRSASTRARRATTIRRPATRLTVMTQHATAAAAELPNCTQCHKETVLRRLPRRSGEPGDAVPPGELRHPPQRGVVGRPDGVLRVSLARGLLPRLPLEPGCRAGWSPERWLPRWSGQLAAAARRGRAAGLESCTTCHQQTECLACHSAKEGWRVNPHGPDFDPERAADRSTQSCAICHTGY